MLKSLLIRNYALIDHLELSPAQGLNMVTGETGAGKSIMLGALGLVMGNRADTKVLLNTEDKCVVEAVYHLEDDTLKPLLEEAEVDFDLECILRREIAPSGKSRAYINDSPVSLEVLRAVSESLIDIHSQHDTLKLAGQAYQLSIVDSYATLNKEVADMQDAHLAYQKAAYNLSELQKRIRQAARERDYTAFQLEELDKVAVQPDEVETLEEELTLLAHAEEIKAKLIQADDVLQSGEGDAITRIKTALQAVEKAGLYATTLLPFAERLQSTLVELKDVAREIETAAERMEFDPRRQEWVQERIGQLNLLLKKHGLSTTEELVNLQRTLLQTLSSIEGLDESAEELEQAQKEHLKKAENQALLLSKLRKEAIPKLELEMNALLVDVGMPNAKLQIELSQITLSAQGVDQVRILFSANKGVAPQDLKTAASGGEFSRLMLCLKYVLAGKTNLPTLIFDEIDTGISGEIALRVGRLMARMAERHQLIVITHMPQIAAKGERHYFVYKEEKGQRTSTQLRELSPQERLQEIAQMIGGANPSATALQNAKELVEGV